MWHPSRPLDREGAKAMHYPLWYFHTEPAWV